MSSVNISRQIYFCGSIRGGRDDAYIYKDIISQLAAYGTVLTEHVGDLEQQEKKNGNDNYIHDRDMNWLLSCDVVVAEVTQPSLGVGYEIGRALENNKPILCLYRPQPGKRLSAMIRGVKKDNFTVKDYKLEDVPEILKDFLK